MNKLQIMGPNGHTTIEFDPVDATTTKTAAEAFAEKLLNGYVAVAPGADGAPGRVLREFDPNVERIIMRPPMAGG